jgi:hypothetical protein
MKEFPYVMKPAYFTPKVISVSGARLSNNKIFAFIREFGESAQIGLANVGKSGESAQKGLANVGESGEPCKYVST